MIFDFMAGRFYEEAIQKISHLLIRFFMKRVTYLMLLIENLKKLQLDKVNGFIADLLLLEFVISSTLSLIKGSQKNRYSLLLLRFLNLSNF